MRIWLILLVLPLGAVGCGDVEPSDVVGTWVMEAESRDRLPPEFQGATAKIEVRLDGNFVATELPTPIPPAGPGEWNRFEVNSGGGTWRLVSSSGTQSLQLNFSDFVSAYHDTRGPYSFHMVVSTGRRARLYYYPGDPDVNAKIAFEKQ